jgi:hypothetical protein
MKIIKYILAAVVMSLVGITLIGAAATNMQEQQEPQEQKVGTSIPTISPFFYSGAGYAQMSSSTAGLRIPGLASLDCIGTDADGDFGEGTCTGGGGSGFSTTSTDYWLTEKSTDDLAEGVNQYFTQERAQDAVGGILTDSSTIDFTYNDAGGIIQAAVIGNHFSTTSANYWETQQTARTADDLTNNSIEDLSDVAAMTENYGDLFAWNGSSWTDFATSSLDLFATGLGASDFGSFTCNGTTCTIDSQAVSASMLANADFGDFTVSGGSATIDANAVALGTDTTGNYLATLADAGGNTLTISGSGSESAAVTAAINLANANTWSALQTFGNASTTILSGTTLCISTDCRTSWPSGGGVAYPFGDTGNATSTLTQFNGGLTAYASTTIGNGTLALTVSGSATTTGDLFVQGGDATVRKEANSSLGGNMMVSNDFDGGYGSSYAGYFLDKNRKAGLVKVTTGTAGVGDIRLLMNTLTNNSESTLSDTVMTVSTSRLFGFGTTSPYAKLSVVGDVVAANFVATTSTASIFPYASSTALSATTLCLSTDCRTSWPAGGSSFDYLFPSNATSTLLSFNGGASTTQLSAATAYFNFFNATSTTATSTITNSLRINSGSGDNALSIAANRVYPASNSVGGMLLLSNGTTNTGPAFVAYTNVTTSSGNLANFRCDNSSMAHDCVKIDHDGAGDGLAIAATAAASNALSLSNTGVDHTLNAAYTGSTADKGAANFTSTNTAGSVFQATGDVNGLGIGKITHSGVGDANSSILSLAASNSSYAGQGIFLDMASSSNAQKVLNIRADGNEVLTTSAGGTTTVPQLAVSGALSLLGTYGTSLSAFCTAITGGPGLCDGTDDSGGSSFAYPFPGNATSTKLDFNGGASTTMISALSAQFGGVSSTTISNLGAIGVFTNDPRWPIHMFSSRNMSSAGTMDLLNANIKTTFNAATNGAATGITFGVSNVIDNAGGAGIMHERTGSNSNGKLHFGTRSDGGTGNIPIRMTIGETGNVGVATTSPEARIDAWGASGGKIMTLFSDAGTKFMEMLNTGITTLLGTWDFTSAVVKLPNGSNPTADDAGEFAHDTTDNQIIVDDLVVAKGTQKIWSSTFGSTSPAFISEGLLKIPTELDGYTMTAIRCSVQGGTSKVIAVEDESGNSTEDITCATSVTSDDGSITNATATAAEEMYIDFGATSGAVDYVSISVFGTWTRE